MLLLHYVGRGESERERKREREREREREEGGGGFTEEDVDETMNGESTYQN